MASCDGAAGGSAVTVADASAARAGVLVTRDLILLKSSSDGRKGVPTAVLLAVVKAAVWSASGSEKKG